MPPDDMRPTVVLDASVAVRWVIEEVGSDDAARLLERDVAWITPRLMLTEVAAALRRKVADGVVEAAIAGQSLDALLHAVADGVIRLADDEAIVSAAVLLAVSLGHRVPDCVYLAGRADRSGYRDRRRPARAPRPGSRRYRRHRAARLTGAARRHGQPGREAVRQVVDEYRPRSSRCLELES